MRSSQIDLAADFSATFQKISEFAIPPWQVLDWSQGGIAWRSFYFVEDLVPRQGWKIHVSAAAVEAPGMLSLVAPILFEHAAPFKMPRRLKDVVLINSGDTGELQVGKVVTIYPRDDDHAGRIIPAVDAVWHSTRGPEVQSDLHIRPGSPVSLRYGVFGSGSAVTDSKGVQEAALTGADGTASPDTRRRAGEQWERAPSPPVACCPPRGYPIEVGKVVGINGNRYVPLEVLKSSPKSKTFLALAVETLATVILKVATPGVGGDQRGEDARDRLRKEYRFLTQLAGRDGVAPTACDWLEAEWPVLVMEDFRGRLLSELDRQQRVSSLAALAACLEQLHGAGIVHCDLKLDNAVCRDGKVGLIDFELAELEGAETGPGGTRGYMGPEVEAGSQAAASRDIYALGGCVAEAILGIPLGLLPNGPDRLASLLELEGATAAAKLVSEFSQPDPEARPDAAAAATAIRAAEKALLHHAPGPAEPPSQSELDWSRRASSEAACLVRNYAEDADTGLCWRNEHFMSSFHCEGINIGAAGIVLGLATVDHALGQQEFSDDILAGARWLAARRAEGNAAGLFTGNAGVALALAVAGRRLGNADLVSSARSRLRVAAEDDRELDLFSGCAGVLWTSCLLSEILEDEWPLEYGAIAAHSLARQARQRDGIPVWLVDPDADTAYLGCAHGSAGVALALACWGRRTGDQDTTDLAAEAFRQIRARGQTEDRSALRMSPEAERHHVVGNWCHGTAGYLWSLLIGFGDHEALRDEIDWAVGSVQDSMAVGTPTYCHGLAGQLELWRMVSDIPRYRTEGASQAAKVMRALRTLHHEIDRKITWISDDPTITTPDLWIGFLGPATALALYSAEVKAPLLSAEWLSSCSNVRRGSQGRGR